MRIDVVYPTLPPVIDGIGDHTVLLARELARSGHRVRLLTRAAHDRVSPGDGIEVVDVWPRGARPAARPLARLLRDDPPDAVLLQFEQFAYGARGINPEFSLLFRLLRVLRVPSVRVMFAHEAYVMPEKPRWIPMWLVQAAQFRALVRSADVVCVSADLWIAPVRRAGGAAEVVPIFSNIPLAHPMPEVQGLGPTDVVAVWFGYLDEHREPYFEEFVTATADDARAVPVYIGKDHERAAALLEGRSARARVVAHASAAQVSGWLRAADVAVAPFGGGVSARRGSFLAALAHGARAVTTTGPATDATLLRAWADDVFAAAEGADGFGAVLREELVAIGVRGSRSAVVRQDAADFYAKRFSPASAAARIVTLIGASRTARR